MRKITIIATIAAVLLTMAAVTLAVYSYYRARALRESMGTRAVATETPAVAAPEAGTDSPGETRAAAAEPDLPPQYILSLWDGYVAVFYADNRESVKQVTDTPAVALSLDERQRLANGITIADEEQLVKLLQDYGS